MMTIDEAAALIADAVFERREPDAEIPRCDFENYRARTLKPIRAAYMRAMISAFERGEIRLHSAVSLLPMDPAVGVGVAILGGRVQAPEANRWLAALGVPISIEQPIIKATASDVGEPVLWHRDPVWRKKIFDCATAVAEEHLLRGWGGTKARDVMEEVARRMAQERGFPAVAPESIRKYGLSGWTFEPFARSGENVPPIPSADTPSLGGAVEQSGADLGAEENRLD